jgi:hypothetical protein
MLLNAKLRGSTGRLDKVANALSFFSLSQASTTIFGGSWRAVRVRVHDLGFSFVFF